VTDLPEGIERRLADRPRRWLVTGSAGFIGSHLIEVLLRAGQSVVSIDNFSTGHRANLGRSPPRRGRERLGASPLHRRRHHRPVACASACEGVEVVLHQAALGSVPRSIDDPVGTHNTNATGFLNVIIAARDAGVKRFVYAASSSTYGDSTALPKVEDSIGRPLSPYAVTKYLNELYADVFARCYGLATIGLRYFNVFGPRQDPQGAYAAVIPRWAAAMLAGEPCLIYGDGETSRDFCFVANVVQANLRAALVEDADALNQIYNVAVGDRTTLAELHAAIAASVQALDPTLQWHRRDGPISETEISVTLSPMSARRVACSATNPPTTCAQAWPTRPSGTFRRRGSGATRNNAPDGVVVVVVGLGWEVGGGVDAVPGLGSAGCAVVDGIRDGGHQVAPVGGTAVGIAGLERLAEVA
jgi:UDP-N-acetylglucosamine 4-epimerase